jgi:hypothetical protein
MKCGRATVFSFVAFLGLNPGMNAANSSGASGDGPYRAIVDRNIFDLRPPPVNSGPVTPAAPPPNVKLVGLMLISGHPQGVYSILDQSTPGKQPVSYILSENQRQASLEVKSIDMKGETSRVQIGDQLVDLKLEEPKAPMAPAAAPAGMTAGAQRPFVAGRGGRAFPMPTPGGGYAAPAPAAPSYSPTPGAGAGGLPTRPVRTDGGLTAEQQAMTPEQSLAQLEQSRQYYQQNNPALAQLLPPNPYQPQQPQTTQPEPETGSQSTPSSPSTTQQAPLGSRTTGTFRMPPPLPPMPGR